MTDLAFIMPTMKALADELRRLRELKGLSQEKAADLLEMARTNYVRIESGKRPVSVDFIFKFTETLELQNSLGKLIALKLGESIPKPLEVIDPQALNDMRQALQSLSEKLGYNTVDDAIKAAKKARANRKDQ